MITRDLQRPSAPAAAAAAPPPASAPAASAPSATTVGVAYGLAAYCWWGVIPVYFRWMDGAGVGALEMLAHRVIWSVVLLAVLLRVRGQGARWWALFRSRRTLLTLLATTVLIAVNWGVFIYTVETDRLLQASLGYFINPLLSVLLGFLFLGERLRGWQPLAVLLAALGVIHLAWGAGETPTLALILASSFGLYGLLRKVAPVEPVAGLLLETVLLAPLAIAFLAWLGAGGAQAAGLRPMAFLHAGVAVDFGLLAAGAVTTLPLLWFTNAARRLPLATIGFMQYIAPSGQFVLAVTAGEAFTTTHAWTFGLIWTGLLVYTLDALARRRRRPAGPPAAAPPGR